MKNSYLEKCFDTYWDLTDVLLNILGCIDSRKKVNTDFSDFRERAFDSQIGIFNDFERELLDWIYTDGRSDRQIEIKMREERRNRLAPFYECKDYISWIDEDLDDNDPRFEEIKEFTSFCKIHLKSLENHIVSLFDFIEGKNITIYNQEEVIKKREAFKELDLKKKAIHYTLGERLEILDEVLNFHKILRSFNWTKEDFYELATLAFGCSRSTIKQYLTGKYDTLSDRRKIEPKIEKLKDLFGKSEG